MAEETEDEGRTDRRTCTLAVVTTRRLEKLARRGTHGTSVPKVMAHFIETGIREAIEKRYIELGDDE